MPPIVPLVLYHGKQKWTVSARLADIIQGGNIPEFKLYLPDFSYILYDLSNSIKQLELCAHTPWGLSCPAGNGIVGLDSEAKLKKPCVMGHEVDCLQCGCAVPQFMYLVQNFDIRAMLSSLRILSRHIFR